MKLGILTFHSQLNYGGVLQCWALKMVLEANPKTADGYNGR